MGDCLLSGIPLIMVNLMLELKNVTLQLFLVQLTAWHNTKKLRPLYRAKFKFILDYVRESSYPHQSHHRRQHHYYQER